MAKHPLKFIELHNPLFMLGTNFGTKIMAAQRQIQFVLDSETGSVDVLYKGEVGLIGSTNVSFCQYIQIPEELKTLFGLNKTPEPERVLPPALAKAKKNKEASMEEVFQTDAEAHRAQVRAASANSNKAAPSPIQTNDLIQDSRSTALGFKAQVSNPTRPTEGASVMGKPKAISHAQMNAIVAAEAKE